MTQEKVQERLLEFTTKDTALARTSKLSGTVYITYPDDMENIPGTGQKKQELSASKVYEIFRRIRIYSF